MSSDAPSGLEYDGTDGPAGPAVGGPRGYRHGTVETAPRPTLGPTPRSTGVSDCTVSIESAAYRAELTMRAAEVAALERELVRRERRHDLVVERYETLLERRSEPDPEAGCPDSDESVLAAIRDRLPR